MSRKYNRSQKWNCSVPDCKSEWMTAQIGKFCFCEDHLKPASELYHLYKEYTNKALETYDSELLIKASELRKLYAKTFIGKDNESHEYFCELLLKLSNLPFKDRKKTWIDWINKINYEKVKNTSLYKND